MCGALLIVFSYLMCYADGPPMTTSSPPSFVLTCHRPPIVVPVWCERSYYPFLDFSDIRILQKVHIAPGASSLLNNSDIFLFLGRFHPSFLPMAAHINVRHGPSRPVLSVDETGRRGAVRPVLGRGGVRPPLPGRGRAAVDRRLA